jgi:preprotein translocase subunit SecE
MDIKKYFNEVKTEMNKVSWPSRQRTVKDSALVIAASIGTSLFIGGVDLVFQGLTSYIITK